MGKDLLSLKEARKLRDRQIRALYRAPFNLSMEEICAKIGVSKTTVFFAINGRSKKAVARTAHRAAVRKILNSK